jgi:hypothetical protein
VPQCKSRSEVIIRLCGVNGAIGACWLSASTNTSTDTILNAVVLTWIPVHLYRYFYLFAASVLVAMSM